MQSFISQLDTTRFGFKIAKINTWPIDVNTVLDSLRKEQVKLVIARVNSEEISTINQLEELGFSLKDIQLTYRFDYNKLTPKPQINELTTIRDATETDIPMIAAIAQESFINHGHYFANEKLKKEDCMRVYEDWAKRSCIDKNVADKVYVALVDGQPAGFITYKIYSKDHERYASCGLGAVAKPYRKYGIYRALLNESLMWGNQLKLSWQDYNALATNYSVARVLSTLGFSVANSFVTLHSWLE